jgi:hypothetical protein
MRRTLFLGLALAGCSGSSAGGNGADNPDGGQSGACAAYLACADATGNHSAGLNSKYGPNGSCGRPNPDGIIIVSDAGCATECLYLLNGLQSEYPDAGAACQFDTGIWQPLVCEQYLACAYATGAETRGSQDGTYGFSGTCWKGSASMAQGCTDTCEMQLNALNTAHPDAGPICTGHAAICDEYLACNATTGGDLGFDKSFYGTYGNCWTTTPASINECIAACQSAVLSLRLTYPDAGAACRP